MQRHRLSTKWLGGWFKPDVDRTLFPWFRRREVDRAWAIEQEWSKANCLADDDTGETLNPVLNTSLGSWGAKTDNLPALVFNSTVVETGKPLVLSTTTFPSQSDQDSRGILNFHSLYKKMDYSGYDLRIDTAVRLSASFPYVAPAARSNLIPVSRVDFHVVDGGYYDNYGVNSLLAWLEEATHSDSRSLSLDGDSFLIIRIVSFPPEATDERKEHGWGFQLVAPFLGQYNTRVAGQTANDDTQLRFFAKSFPAQANLRSVSFQYSGGAAGTSCQSPPLSWQLSKQQIECIDSSWASINAKSKECVGKLPARRRQQKGLRSAG